MWSPKHDIPLSRLLGLCNQIVKIRNHNNEHLEKLGGKVDMEHCWTDLVPILVTFKTMQGSVNKSRQQGVDTKETRNISFKVHRVFWYGSICDKEKQIDMRLCTEILVYYHEECVDKEHVGLSEKDEEGCQYPNFSPKCFNHF